MTIPVLVLSETYKTGTGRVSKQPYEMLTIRCIDKSMPKATRTKTVLEVTLSKEDVAYRGQLEDELVTIAISEIRGEFGGCAQASGSIVREAQAIA